MKARYLPPQSKHAYGNVMFDRAYPAKNGKFPKDHPFAPSQNVFDNYPSIGTGEKLEALREAGYYVSCFPEGDGLCFSAAASYTQEKIIEDIVKFLGVELTVIKEA